MKSRHLFVSIRFHPYMIGPSLLQGALTALNNFLRVDIDIGKFRKRLSDVFRKYAS